MTDLVGPQPIGDDWADHLARLIANAPVNLVSRGDRRNVRRVHVDECARIVAELQLRAGMRWMDLGTGGGLPGLVCAAAFPDVSWTLVDARAKKIAQVAEFARTLALVNVEAVHGRAEDLVREPRLSATFDGVISRAVGSLEQTVALSRGFVTSGQIVAIRGPRAPEEAERVARWSDDLGLLVDEVLPIDGTIRPTWLVRMRGQGPVPAHFPRTRRTLLRSTRGGSSDGSA